MSDLEKTAQVVYESCYGRNLHPGQVSSIVRGLNDAGLLMPDLPEPDAVKLNGDVKYLVCDGVQVRQDAESDHVHVYSKSLLSTTEARRLAMALLAAADYAEKRHFNE